MKKKFLILSILLSLILPIRILAKVPYSEIEQLRRHTIIASVASMRPHSPQLKRCQTKLNEKNLSTNLALAQSQATKQWQLITITTEDLHDLDRKAQACVLRASCTVYHAFISAAQVDPTIQQEVEILKMALEKKVKRLGPNSYSRAWTSVPKPCDLLQQIMK